MYKVNECPFIYGRFRSDQAGYLVDKSNLKAAILTAVEKVLEALAFPRKL